MKNSLYSYLGYQKKEFFKLLSSFYMNMTKWITNIFHKLVLAETDANTLTLSFCLGAFLAFSPYLGVQTWLVFPLCWIFGLNITVAMSSLYLISNPFTFIPIIVSGYFFGQWFVLKVVRWNVSQYNPAFVQSFLAFLSKHVIDLRRYLGSDLCFICYFIGANLLAIAVATIAYCITKPIFVRLTAKVHKQP